MLKKRRGRKPVELKAVDIRDFALEFEKKPLQALWRTLYDTNKWDCVRPLLRLFLAHSPRFWKVCDDKQHIEVIGWFGDIRTHGEIHIVAAEDFVNFLFNELANIIQDNLPKMGYCSDDTQKHFKLGEYMDMECRNLRHAKAFLLYSFSQEFSRRTGMVRYRRQAVRLKVI